MMDAHDTNQPLNQGELEEEKKTVEVSEAITIKGACTECRKCEQAGYR